MIRTYSSSAVFREQGMLRSHQPYPSEHRTYAGLGMSSTHLGDQWGITGDAMFLVLFLDLSLEVLCKLSLVYRCLAIFNKAVWRNVLSTQWSISCWNRYKFHVLRGRSQIEWWIAQSLGASQHYLTTPWHGGSIACKKHGLCALVYVLQSSIDCAVLK